MEIVFNRTLLIDGSYMLHRQLSVINQWDLQTTTGKRTGGVFGVIKSVFKEMQKYNYFPIMVFDGGLAPRRLALYSNYKRNEEKQLLLESTSYAEKTEQQLMDEAFMREYRTQRKDIIEFMHGMGIPCIRIKDWEGDDLLYILSKMSKDSIIISDDKDLIQAAFEDENRRCRIWRTMHEEMLDTHTLEKEGLNAWSYINRKAICGDPSDNIPSACYGVGEKTALDLIKLYESCKSNNVSFPHDENSLADACIKAGISKRKAYTNFDEAQFIINMELMNLKLVDNDITEQFVNKLYDEIMMELEMPDENIIRDKIEELEMFSLDTKSMRNKVIKLKDYLRIEDRQKVENHSEETITHLF